MSFMRPPFPLPPPPYGAVPPSPFLGMGGPLPPPPIEGATPMDLGEDDPTAIDPTTGQPMGGWNKARSVAGPIAGLLGLIALAKGKRGLAAGALGFGQAAQGGWQQDRAKYERLKEREDIESQEWARKKRDELDEIKLDDPQYAQLKQTRADLTKALAERKLRPGLIKKFQQTLGAQSELMQQAREATEIGKAERLAVKRAEMERRASEEKEIAEYERMGMPRPIAVQQIAKDRALKMEAERAKAESEKTAPSELAKFQEQVKEHGLSRAIQWAQLAESKAYHRELQQDREARRREVQGRFDTRQALSRELAQSKEGRFEEYELDKAVSTVLYNSPELGEALGSDDPKVRAQAMKDVSERSKQLLGAKRQGLTPPPSPIPTGGPSANEAEVRGAMERIRAARAAGKQPEAGDVATVTTYKNQTYGK